MTSVTHPIQTKLGLLFDVIDTDKDGNVDWTDHQKIIDRYLTTYKIDKNDQRAQALAAFYQMYWLELRRHSGSEDSLTRDQFIDANQALIVDTSRFNMVEGIPHSVFDIMDTDGDGSISTAELKKYLDASGTTGPEVTEQLSRLDTDGDGSISRGEFIRAARQFFYSPETHTPSSLIFGITS